MRSSYLIAAILAVGAPNLAMAKGTPKKKATPAAKAAPKKPKATPLTAEHKKALADLYAGFKFGMSKDEVLGVLQKQIDDNYEDKIKATTDIAAQDRLRKDKKAELARTSQTYVSFDTNTRTGWDVSIIENEFAHGTGESMMDRWENQGGKNNRRFFFFKDGKLWKMFVSLDVSVLPEDKKNFATLESYMEAKYGPGDSDVEHGTIMWRAGEFEARAIDRLKDYDAIGIAIEDPKIRTEVLAEREQHAPPKHETPAVIKAVIDTDNKDHPDIKSNTGAVDAVIQAQGGKK